MSSLYNTVKSADFQNKIVGLFERYADMPMVYSHENNTPYYSQRHRLTELDDVFEGNMFIEVAPAPNQESSLVVSKASLYIVTDDGPEFVMSRFGRAEYGALLRRNTSNADLTNYSAIVATRRLLEAMGMPSNDIRQDFAMGEYQLLEQRLEQLKITLATAIGEYNNSASTNKSAARIKKASVSDLNVFELNALLRFLPVANDVETV